MWSYISHLRNDKGEKTHPNHKPQLSAQVSTAVLLHVTRAQHETVLVAAGIDHVHRGGELRSQATFQSWNRSKGGWQKHELVKLQAMGKVEYGCQL